MSVLRIDRGDGSAVPGDGKCSLSLALYAIAQINQSNELNFVLYQLAQKSIKLIMEKRLGE